MKVLQISAYFKPRTGGSERYCHELSKRLVERGHEVHVITSRLDKHTSVNETIDGLHVHRCPCLGAIWGVNPGTFILHKLFRWKPDVIHTHSYIFLTSNQAVLAAKLARIPVLLHLHGGIDAIQPPNDFSTRLKFHVKKTFYDPTLGKWTVQAADAVASVSKRDIECAQKLWGLDGKNLDWVPNGIDLDEINGNDCGNGHNVVFIGRLEPWKGIHALLEVAKLVGEERDDVDFVIAGDGNLRRYVEEVGSSFNNHIKVLGQVPHKMIPSLLAEAAVLVLPSYMEGLPTVCLEALANEVPVVASNVGGVPEVVIDGETGYLFPSGNTRLCAEKVSRLLSNEVLRGRMGRRGRSLVERFYTWEKVVEKVEKIYENMGS